MPLTQPERSVRVFISYAHTDQELRKKLENHLSPLSYSGEIMIWQDQEIPAGANWEHQIHTHLDGADIILLLISADFIASKYCWNKEVQAALQRHQAGTVRVIPIILRPVRWQKTPLGQLQALPAGAKPVTQWNDHDAALENVVEGIQGVVDALRSPVLSSASPPLSAEPTIPASPDWTKEQWIEIGNEHDNARRYTEALVAYEQAIRLDPNFASAYERKGCALNELKRHQEALNACEQAIRLDPNLAEAHNNKGWALLELKRHQEALNACEQAIRLDPNLAEAHSNKGWALIELKRHQEALNACEQAIRLDPNLAVAYQNKGAALYYLGRQTESGQALAKARQLGYNP